MSSARRAPLGLCLLALACAKQEPPAPPTPAEPPRATASAAVPLVAAPEDAGDFLIDEHRLLRQLVETERDHGKGDARTSEALGALARLYEAHHRADEYSNMRARMLASWELRQAPGAPPGPPPGGPFARPGLGGYDGEKQSPPSLLSHWMNRRVTPELYEDTTYEKIVARLEASVEAAAARSDALAEAAAQSSLANVHAAMAAFPTARLHARRALDLRRKALGARNEATLRSEAALKDIDFDRP